MQSILKPFASLTLTVVLLALTMVLIFAGTWAQIDYDVWTVQKRYFHTFFTWVHLQLFLPREQLPEGSVWKPVVQVLRPLGFPMPGGYLLIALLLLNLLAAHTVRFKLSRRRVGIILIHAGLILLILGEVVASLYQREGRMTIEEGQTVSFTEDIRQVELAVVDPAPAEHARVTVIPAARLAREGTINYPTLPFEIRIERYLANTDIAGPVEAERAGGEFFRPTAVADAPVVIVPVRQTSGTSGTAVDTPSAVVALYSNGQALGRYVLTTIPLNPQMPQINAPQAVNVGGKTYLIQLRWKRDYKPYALKLLEFRFDRYTGTNVARNFSSRVQLIDPERSQDREVLIWMNNPLRYAGETFYQADWNKVTERGTVLQVVRNPGWLMPYISCTMVGLGMLIHFGMHLLGFLSRGVGEDRPAPAPPTRGRQGKSGRSPKQYELRPRGGVVVPMLVTMACVLMVLAAGRPPRHDVPFDLNTFSRVPISYEGRVMPLDTLSRVTLRVMSGKSTFADESGKRQPAIRWLAEVMSNPQEAAEYRVLRVDQQDVKALLGLEQDRKMFAISEIGTRFSTLAQQAQQASRVARKDQNLFQRSVLELYQHVMLWDRLASLETLFVAPPAQGETEWKQFGQAMREEQMGQPANPGMRAFMNMISSYHHDQPESFNASAAGYLDYVASAMPKYWRRANFEVLFNWLAPFYQCMILYVLVFLLTCAAWLIEPWRPTLMRTAYWVLMLALVIHTLGLIARVYIQGRPPVTNLYSSAVFIGWATVVFCAFIEKIYRNGVGNLSAAVVAFPSLVIAHFLAGSGDTMQMLQAVLDTNFWLATHVVVITIGYSATFLAGIIAIIYVIGGIFTPALHQERRKTLARMTYGVVCFAVLFSFVGTILGGIWADQSWGRFWGWDPKENGAALLVLWNAIILHARWGGLVRERGFMLLAIFGNVITAFSWFGTNMLGIGLHSYGFMDSAVFWISAFTASQLLLIGLGNLPLSKWRSVAAD